MHPSENRAYDLTAPKLGSLLRDIVDPAYRDAKGVPSVEVMPFRDLGTLEYTRRWARAGGSEPLQRTITLAATPDGPKGDQMIRGMVLDAWYARYHRPGDANSYLPYIRGIDHDGSRLASIGIVGFFDPDTGTVPPWAVVRSAWAAKLAQRSIPVPASND